MKNNTLVLFVLFSLFWLLSCKNNEPKNTQIHQNNKTENIRNASPNATLVSIIKKSKTKKTSIWLSIDKKNLTLSVMADEKQLKTYPVVLGFNEKDDKRLEGDGCTPEGDFKALSKYKHAKWSRFIWVNYPTEDSERKHQLAKKEGKIPENATVGSEIGIHGVPNNDDSIIDKYNHWTLGCISLKTAHIIEVYDVVDKNTRISIK